MDEWLPYFNSLRFNAELIGYVIKRAYNVYP